MVDEIIPNARAARIHVIKLAADILDGSVGDAWTERDDAKSQWRLKAAMRQLTDELRRRAAKLKDKDHP